jgi:hypothetical protein
MIKTEGVTFLFFCDFDYIDHFLRGKMTWKKKMKKARFSAIF